MKISTVFRHLREGTKSVFRNGWMSFASASAIAVSLFIVGVFLLLMLNVDHMASEIEDQVEIRVFLDVVVDEAGISQVQNEIGGIPEVSKITFVSKEEGLQEMKEKLGEIIAGYEGDNNPLPDSFVVRADKPENVPYVAQRIEAINSTYTSPPILEVKYGQGTVERLFDVIRTIRIIGVVIVAGLAFTAMFLISNTIKLTILSRSREISIMKLVGATNGFIRWPFFIEGALLGFIGSLIPISIILTGYMNLVEQTKMEMGLMQLELLPVEEIGWPLIGLLTGIGVMIGIWGTTVSVRKFLKV